MVETFTELFFGSLFTAAAFVAVYGLQMGL